MAVERLYSCSAAHIYTANVQHDFEGHTIWQGNVEVFAIEGHPKAKRCYAWSHGHGKDGPERFSAVLAVPPVVSPETATLSSIFSIARQRSREDEAH